MEWKNDIYVLALFDLVDFSELKPVTQVQAVCFSGDDMIVLYKNFDGSFGLPGGTPEQDESSVATLKRELFEEVSVNTIECGPIGYMKSYKKDQPEKFWFQLRYWARVRCLDETPDPDNKSMGRVLVPVNKAAEKLHWGEMGELLIKLAKEGAGRVK